MYRYVLFDLDGTLSDSKEGIVKSGQVALHEMGVEVSHPDELECLIGPPLAESFRDFYGLNEEQCEEAIRIFRDRYVSIGIYENELYPGMRQLLEDLKERGVKLAVASSKPQSSVDRLMKYFDIAQFFDVAMGGDPARPHQTKQEVLLETLAKLFGIREDKIVSAPVDLPEEERIEAQKRAARILPVREIAMVGDRKFDMIAAREFFIDGIGVEYGYAPEGELEESKATCIATDLDDLYEILTGEKATIHHGAKVPALRKSLRILMPVVVFFVITQLCLFLMSSVITLLAGGPLQSLAPFIAANSGKIAVYSQAVASMICAVVFYRIYRGEPPALTSRVLRRRAMVRFRKHLVLIILFSASLALFLNGAISYLQIVLYSNVYDEVSRVQYSVSLASGLLIFGIIKPIEEELVFRGLLYNRMRYYFPKPVAILGAALFFGAYHGNMVQFVYAFFMGTAICYLYERFRLLEVPLLMHATANILIYTMSSAGVLEKTFLSPAGCACSFILSLSFGLILWRSMKKR